MFAAVSSVVLQWQRVDKTDIVNYVTEIFMYKYTTMYMVHAS